MSRVEKDKDGKKHSKSSTSSSSGGDKDEASKKEKCCFPPVKDNHACGLWISGLISFYLRIRPAMQLLRSFANAN